MSPEPTGVHGLLKQRKLFTHKKLICLVFLSSIYEVERFLCLSSAIELDNIFSISLADAMSLASIASTIAENASIFNIDIDKTSTSLLI